MRSLALILFLLPIAAVAQEIVPDEGTEMPPAPEVELADTCGAGDYRILVGQSGEIARLLELEAPMRVVGPDTAVTLDFRPDRLNFVLDEDDRIVGVECG
ncbi:hypothetical protein HKCCE3408_13095 [Rhodobacterales bacterium HKCCE3408]|nr:hypothetical protein [Rhodobacterales bacterium HKCCE3408]